MNNRHFKVLLNDKIIGSTSLEKADVPIGVLSGQLQLDNIGSAYDFFKSYCLQEHIGFRDDMHNKFITTSHISNLKVLDTNNTNIKGSAISVSGRGIKDFKIIIEGVPYNILELKFKYHVDHYHNLFASHIDKDNIIEIGIDDKHGIYVKPENAKFPLIYRSVSGVHWDDRRNILYTTNQNGWTDLYWYKRIMDVVRDAYNFAFLLTDKTIWTNIPGNLKQSIIATQKSEGTTWEVYVPEEQMMEERKSIKKSNRLAAVREDKHQGGV